MPAPWDTHDLSDAPDGWSPAGETEIRQLASLPAGGFAHATLDALKTADAAVLSGLTEMFYILEGDGEIWRKHGELEDIVELRRGRCVAIPPGVNFQYRSGDSALRFVVASAPEWRPELWHASSVSHWDHGNVKEKAEPRGRPGETWFLQDLRYYPDYLAPDKSEIRELLAVAGGGLAHCSLGPRHISVAHRHRSVDEIWYVLEGTGELWRSDTTTSDVVELRPGRCVTVPVGAAFQFRCTSGEPLQLLIGTFPRWPGLDEAEPVEGRWS